MKTFKTPEKWLTNSLDIILVGAGGTGSEVLDGLCRMSLAIEKLGGSPFKITIYDDDEVSEANIGRQRFMPADVGFNKAELLATRYNFGFGMDIQAVPERFECSPDTYPNNGTLIVTCTDSAKFRIAMNEYLGRGIVKNVGWLDFGNGSHTGQSVLGYKDNKDWLLPSVAMLYPELAEVDDNDAPSCSLADALAKQDFGVNRFVADAGISIIWQLLRHGGVNHHGAFFDQSKCSMTPLKIDPNAWSFMGLDAKFIKSATGRLGI